MPICSSSRAHFARHCASTPPASHSACGPVIEQKASSSVVMRHILPYHSAAARVWWCATSSYFWCEMLYPRFSPFFILFLINSYFLPLSNACEDLQKYIDHVRMYTYECLNPYMHPYTYRMIHGHVWYMDIHIYIHTYMYRCVHREYMYVYILHIHVLVQEKKIKYKSLKQRGTTDLFFFFRHLIPPSVL